MESSCRARPFRSASGPGWTQNKRACAPGGSAQGRDVDFPFGLGGVPTWFCRRSRRQSFRTRETPRRRARTSEHKVCGRKTAARLLPLAACSLFAPIRRATGQTPNAQRLRRYAVRSSVCTDFGTHPTSARSAPSPSDTAAAFGGGGDRGQRVWTEAMKTGNSAPSAHGGEMTLAAPRTFDRHPGRRNAEPAST